MPPIYRHRSGDPNCSSSWPQGYSLTPDPVATPDSKNFAIQDSCRVGEHLVLQVKYPNCSSCAFEGSKIMVFLNVSERDVLMWREIDPHFRKVNGKKAKEAPSPAARFPATSAGWADACAYAQTKL